MDTQPFVRLGMLILLTGCTAVPTVRYQRIDSAADLNKKQFDSYSLQESVLKLDVARDAKTRQPDFSTFNVTSVPAEYAAFKLGLTHADRWGVRTTLTITKRENTDLVKEVGSEVSDERVELIGKIGGIISKIVPFTTTGTVKPEDLPLVIQTLVHLEQNKITTKGKEGVMIRDGVTIDFGALPKDAQPISQLPLDQRTTAFVYAACRTANVKIRLPENVAYRKSVKIADPRYFQSVRFPLKGKITTHSECGVSVASDANPGVKSSADIADAVVTQVIAVQKALENKEAGK